VCRCQLTRGHSAAAGGLWLQGRAKDVVKSGGENVAAWEVERCLGTHPGVAAAAVVGLPHPRLGEAVAAVVVLAPGWGWSGPGLQALPPGRRAAAAAAAAGGPSAGGIAARAVDGAALQRHCRAQGLAGFKLPRVVAVAGQLPTNATGKVIKSDVKRALGWQSAEQERVWLDAAAPRRARL
jgi:acyl-activating enzyme 14